MVYHSKFNDVEAQTLLGCGLYPLKTKFPGPLSAAEEGTPDIVDEAITMFKANCMFRNFKPSGPGDLVHIYLLLFIHQCLKALEKAKDKADGQRIMNTLAGEAPAVPGDSAFPISVIYPPAQDANEKKEFGKMLTQLRKETASRLPDVIFPDPAAPGTKWWLSFGKRKFLNKNL